MGSSVVNIFPYSLKLSQVTTGGVQYLNRLSPTLHHQNDPFRKYRSYARKDVYTFMNMFIFTRRRKLGFIYTNNHTADLAGRVEVSLGSTEFFYDDVPPEQIQQTANVRASHLPQIRLDLSNVFGRRTCFQHLNGSFAYTCSALYSSRMLYS